MGVSSRAFVGRLRVKINTVLPRRTSWAVPLGYAALPLHSADYRRHDVYEALTIHPLMT